VYHAISQKLSQKQLVIPQIHFFLGRGIAKTVDFSAFSGGFRFPKTAFPKITMSRGKPVYPFRGKKFHSLPPGRAVLSPSFSAIQNRSFIHKNA